MHVVPPCRFRPMIIAREYVAWLSRARGRDRQHGPRPPHRRGDRGSRTERTYPNCRFSLPTEAHSISMFPRSEEHTSELQSLMRISYAVFCLKKKKKKQNNMTNKQ